MAMAVTLAVLSLVTDYADTPATSRELQALWMTHSDLRGHSIALAAAGRRAAREMMTQIGWWLSGPTGSASRSRTSRLNLGRLLAASR